MNQHLLSPGALHDERGKLAEAGYATSLVRTYDRARVRAGALRVKEWDYYLIACPTHALALTVADNGYMGMDSVSLIDLNVPRERTVSRMSAFPMGRRGLPATSAAGDIRAQGKGYALTFAHEGGTRHLTGHMEGFAPNETLTFDITLTETGPDSMVIATPFAGKPHAFYYNQKINCLAARGAVTLGARSYAFGAGSYAVLDWGRGAWTYDNTWYWASASGEVNGVPFGMNLGYGFGDTSAASENMLFYAGRAHKLGQVDFGLPRSSDGRDDYMRPWHFTAQDDRLDMTFTPIIDRAADVNALIIRSDQHQVFGRYSGRAVLDDGQVLDIRDQIGFAEKVHNRW